MSTTMSHSELAQVLFASALQQTDDPSPAQVHTAIHDLLDAVTETNWPCLACLACVAQEAGDHPEVYLLRMRWALTAVEHGDPGLLATT